MGDGLQQGCMVHCGPAVAQTEGRRGTAACLPELGLRALRATGAHRRGRKRERGARGTHLGPHRSTGGGVAAG
jgi:hypothetical protein